MPLANRPDGLVTAKELAAIWNVPPSRVYQYIRSGMTGCHDRRERPRRYLLSECERWLKEDKREPGRPSTEDKIRKRLGLKSGEPIPEPEDSQPATPPPPAATPSPVSLAESLEIKPVAYEEAKLERERWAAFKLKVQALQLQGKLVAAADVRSDRLERIQVVKAALFALPARLAPRLVGKNEERIERELRAAVRAICLEFARGVDDDEIERAAS